MKVQTGHNTHNNVLLGDARVQVIHSHLGAFQRAEDRLPETSALPEAEDSYVLGQQHSLQASDWEGPDPVREPQCPPCPHHLMLRDGVSFPKDAEPSQASAWNTPSSDGTLSLKPSWLCPVEFTALSSLLLAALLWAEPLCHQTQCSVCLFFLLACELCAQGPLDVGLLVCKMGVATPTSERR